MCNPVDTYRIQFHKDFTFTDLERIIPYLKELGVQTIYASPIFEAVPGSTHGYDTLNPHRINPEIGTEKQLFAISEKLKLKGMGWVQDIVPNHMAFDPANPWLMDVLENGDQSAYRDFFDIGFPSGVDDPRIMVPFLGEPLEEAIEQESLKLISLNDKFYLSYYGSNWPVNAAGNNLLSSSNDGTFTKTEVAAVAAAQYYRLCSWTETDRQINFRRFFIVNGLICLNIQHQNVFETYHSYIFSLLNKGVFQGLRVDHIDGLFDPAKYLKDLRTATGPDTYTVVEKILEQEEQMPVDWPVQGSTGYDFLAIANNLFTNKPAEKEFNAIYQQETNDPDTVHDQITVKKSHILYEHMSGELENLYKLFLELSLATKEQLKAISAESIKNAIGLFLIHCPVYRFYGNSFPLAEREQEELRQLFSKIDTTKDVRPAVVLLENLFLETAAAADEAFKQRAIYFYQRCMQFSGPLMAKGVEDTLMYTYNRFIGHNEVGDAPDAFGMRVKDFHLRMMERQANTPLAMNGTSTHDTKRGEDTRARLNVLSDLPEDWEKLVSELKKLDKDVVIPDANDRYLIYQAILGALSMPGQPEDDVKVRISEYLEKALREAKRHSNWSKPDEAYESAAKEYALNLLENPEHLDLIKNFLLKIADFGVINSLSQLILKFTCPGVPDVYQGTESWDLSLVDPDNRRPVDYLIRSQYLKEITEDTEITQLWEERYSGKLKLWLMRQLLLQRKTNALFFEKAAYIPLKVKGKYKKKVIAYARQYKNEWVIIALPLSLASICNEKDSKPEELNWKTTRIILLDYAPLEWVDALSGAKGKLKAAQAEILIEDIFKPLPFAVLKMKQPENDRGAGVLLHITSLPSAFGIGDFGPEARKFGDFLAAAKQKYWQLLPLNPTTESQNHSPYSAYSAMAGNTLLISPELLLEQQLLNEQDLTEALLPVKQKVDFQKAFALKRQVLKKAYQTFKAENAGAAEQQYLDFCEKEAEWLNEYALYTVIKEIQENKPWYEWAEPFKLRDEQALEEILSEYQDQITEVKWQQYIFNMQWLELKEYLNQRNIQLIGDLPFYIGYDSADVWSNPEIFDLDESLNISGVAGVPPDYFNADGQLWGMPVFRWETLKTKNYDWWIMRVGKNLQFYDLLRLDHFRAFSAYWRVPAGDATAVNGSWEPGPSAELFKALQTTFGHLPFIAEDLGEIDDPVYDLRDQFNLPGMKVLQFAFGEDMAASFHIPHQYTTTNCVVYTGTHDNNTTIGWFKEDADAATKGRLSEYTDQQVNVRNVHLKLARQAFASFARIAILPMQDLLGLDESSRLNTPASDKENWVWRMEQKELSKGLAKWLRNLTGIYGRI